MIRRPDDQLDMFLGELLAPASKDDVASMEHPIFSIKKGGDKVIRRYEHNGKFVIITPSKSGSATIWDKDILIYVFTLMRLCLDRGEAIPERFEISAADLLRAIGRGDSGKDYLELYAALDRLRGTGVSTNLSTGLENADEETAYSTWALVSEAHVMRDKDTKRLTRILFKPASWFAQQVLNQHLLTLNPEYFQLTSGLHRRLYELARKHCGAQASWRIGLENLHAKAGVTSPLRTFRHQLRKLMNESESNGSGQGRYFRLLDYIFVLDERDMVHVYGDTENGRRALLDSLTKVAVA